MVFRLPLVIQVDRCAVSRSDQGLANPAGCHIGKPTLADLGQTQVSLFRIKSWLLQESSSCGDRRANGEYCSAVFVTKTRTR